KGHGLTVPYAQPRALGVPRPLEPVVALSAGIRELLGDRRPRGAGREGAPEDDLGSRPRLQAPPRRLRPRVRGPRGRPPRPSARLRPGVEIHRSPPAGDSIPGGEAADHRRPGRLLHRRPAHPLQPESPEGRPPLLSALRGGGPGAGRDPEAPPGSRLRSGPPRRLPG